MTTELQTPRKCQNSSNAESDTLDHLNRLDCWDKVMIWVVRVVYVRSTPQIVRPINCDHVSMTIQYRNDGTYALSSFSWPETYSKTRVAAVRRVVDSSLSLAMYCARLRMATCFAMYVLKRAAVSDGNSVRGSQTICPRKTLSKNIWICKHHDEQNRTTETRMAYHR